MYASATLNQIVLPFVGFGGFLVFGFFLFVWLVFFLFFRGHLYFFFRYCVSSGCGCWGAEVAGAALSSCLLSALMLVGRRLHALIWRSSRP